MMRGIDVDPQRSTGLLHTEYIAAMRLSEAPEHTLGLGRFGAGRESLELIEGREHRDGNGACQ
jgi:hypothetical protein